MRPFDSAHASRADGALRPAGSRARPLRARRATVAFFVLCAVALAAFSGAAAAAPAARGVVLYTVTPTVVGGHGTTSPDAPQVVAANSRPTFTFIPDSGYQIGTVTVDDATVALTGTDQYTFPPVTADHELHVTFVPAGAGGTFTITPSVVGGAEGHGLISPGTPQTVPAGATPTFTFAPDPGYHVDGITVDGAAVAMTGTNRYTFPVVAADHSISVSFAPDGTGSFAIAPSVVGGHGAISPDTTQTVAANATPTFSFTPDSGYKVGEVLIDGAVVAMTGDNRYTFPPVTADHAISVRFSPVDPEPTELTVAAPSPATVKRGRTATLAFRVDGTSASGRADVAITIKTLAGKVVSRKAVKSVPLNADQTFSFTCKLNRGRYRFYVTATSADGGKSTNEAYNTLTVK